MDWNYYQKKYNKATENPCQLLLRGGFIIWQKWAAQFVYFFSTSYGSIGASVEYSMYWSNDSGLKRMKKDEKDEYFYYSVKYK